MVALDDIVRRLSKLRETVVLRSGDFVPIVGYFNYCNRTKYAIPPAIFCKPTQRKIASMIEDRRVVLQVYNLVTTVAPTVIFLAYTIQK